MASPDVNASTLDLLYESASEQARLVRERQISPVELVDAHLDRIDRLNGGLNAFVVLRAEDARAQAREAEAAVLRGDDLGPLHGVPFSCKEAIETAGDRMTVGSRLIDFVAEDDAPVVRRFRDAGGILLGKTNVPELLMCWETDSHVYGRANSAWDPDRTPGGSSGGEAAAISAGLSPIGIGTDGGGSIRVPSHLSGIVGLKGTPGRIPLTGHVPAPANIVSHTCNIGPMARRVEDLSLALGILSGYDAGDPGSIPFVAPPDVAVEALAGTRVGLFTGDGVTPVDPAIVTAVQDAGRQLDAAGLVVEEVQPPGLERAHEDWYLVLDKVIAVAVAELADGRRDELHQYTRDFIRNDFSGLELIDYVNAWTARDAARTGLIEFMADYPLLLGPVASIAAWRHGERAWDFPDGRVEWLEAFSVAEAWNVYGFPAATVQVSQTEDGLPIGVQLVARPWEDSLTLAACQVVEDAVGPYRRPPEA